MKKQSWRTQAFFGLHFDLHGNANDRQWGAGLSVRHLTEQLAKVAPDYVQCDCKGHPGYCSYPTKVGVPVPDQVNDSLRIWRDATRALHIPLVMHYSGVWDMAAIAAHPEFARIDENGQLDPNNTCSRGAYTAAYMAKQMVEIVETYDVDGFWVDGDNWASYPCYCPICRAAFLEETGRTDIPTREDKEGWRAWLDFHRRGFEQHLQIYADAVHAVKPDCTVCSNWAYTIRQPDPVHPAVDYLSGDFPHIWSMETTGAEARLLSGRGMDWELMAWGFTSTAKQEAWVFKSPDALCQEAAMVLSHGGAFLIYDTPNRDGSLVPWHMDELSKVAKFCRARRSLCEGTEAEPQAAILHAASHFYADIPSQYALEENIHPVYGAMHALLDNGYSCEILTEPDFVAQLSRYPLAVIPEQTRLSEETIEACLQYVRMGGSLILSGAEATRPFDEVLGVEDEGRMLTHRADGICAAVDPHHSFPLPGVWRAVRGPSADAPICFGRDHTDSRLRSPYPFMRCVSHGTGRICAFFGDLFAGYWRGRFPQERVMVARAIDLCGAPLMRVSLPEKVQLIARRAGNDLRCNLLAIGSNRPQSANSAYIESVPVLTEELRLTVPCTTPPKQVSSGFGHIAAATWENNLLTVTVDRLDIHDVITIRQ